MKCASLGHLLLLLEWAVFTTGPQLDPPSALSLPHPNLQVDRQSWGMEEDVLFYLVFLLHKGRKVFPWGRQHEVLLHPELYWFHPLFLSCSLAIVTYIPSDWHWWQ